MFRPSPPWTCIFGFCRARLTDFLPSRWGLDGKNPFVGLLAGNHRGEARLLDHHYGLAQTHRKIRASLVATLRHLVLSKD
jgi:hypothetical protein